MTTRHATGSAEKLPVLRLALKAEYFHAIKRGEKPEEYVRWYAEEPKESTVPDEWVPHAGDASAARHPDEGRNAADELRHPERQDANGVLNGRRAAVLFLELLRGGHETQTEGAFRHGRDPFRQAAPAPPP